ncbi:MAG: hypothetical protein ACJ8F1_00500 [Polyangia bacterium]
MERCGRCGERVGEIPAVTWWCWWCGRALCDGCGGSDTATCGVKWRTCDRSPRRAPTPVRAVTAQRGCYESIKV